MEIIFIPLDYSYKEIGGKTYMIITGKTKEGKSCCVFHRFNPYFYVLSEHVERTKQEIEKLEAEHLGHKIKALSIKIEKKRFFDKPVKAIKVIVKNHRDMQPLAERIKRLPHVTECLETDISLVTKYIIASHVRPLVWHKVHGKLLNNEPELYGADMAIDTDICVLADKISMAKEQPDFKPKVLAFDIEASEFQVGKGEILMLAVSCGKLRKVITWQKANKRPGFVEYVADEAELIERFMEIVQEEKPDIIVGYFSDGFDLPYLRARAEKYKIRLALGLDESNVRFIRGVINSAKIFGRVHIDLFKFVSNILAPSLQSETLTLDEVARELIGEGKIKLDIKNGVDGIDLLEFYRYNLQDAVITEKLFRHLWPNLQEIARLVQEPLFDICRDTYSHYVENYILHNLERFNEIAPRRPEPEPGLYENIVMFDFTSLYPSIIVSFNISPATLLKEKQRNCYETPEFELYGKKVKFWFKKQESFIPKLIAEIMEKRKAVKKLAKAKESSELKARNHALKTIMNAAYGYYAFFGARYYSLECAASITAYGRHYIKRVIAEAEKKGFHVIYSDTDSLAIALGKKTKQDALSFLHEINAKLPGAIELELEDFYKRGIFVSKRTVKTGAKKKYALLSERNKLKIRGFETVRRDWCQLAKEVQSKVIEMILQDGNHERALAYVEQVISKIKRREVKRDKLVIRTQLKKPLSEYLAVSPHVVIAKKMQERGLPIGPGTLIEYYVAETKNKGKGKQLVRERAKLPDEPGDYDIEYYLRHQILPAVENIFEIFNIDVKEIIEKKGQKKLLDF